MIAALLQRIQRRNSQMKRGMRQGIGGNVELPGPLQGEDIMFINQETIPSNVQSSYWAAND